MIVALAALVIAAGGTATAATLITGAQIKDGTVTTADIKNGTIRVADLSAAAVNALRGAPGVNGLNGVNGAPGPQGPKGLIDPSKLQIVTGPDVLTNPGDVTLATADCPAGARATGGGFFSSIDSIGGDLPGFSSWTVLVANQTSIPITVNAYAVCVMP